MGLITNYLICEAILRVHSHIAETKFTKNDIGKVIGDELSLMFTLAPTTTHHHHHLRSYPGLYLSPGVRYLRSVKGKNYFYDVGNPLRFFFFYTL